MIQIANEQLVVIITDKGAELQSIQLNGLEYLWQADAQYWGKHSPILFPIVGELKDGKYIFDRKEYFLPRHGFARDKIFEVEQTSETSATFTLHSSDETLAVYPFQFIFQIQYEIKQHALYCSYIIQNVNNSDMYFSVGGHPAFKVPLQDNLQYTDYTLEFDNDSVLNRFLLNDGLTKDNTEAIALNKNKLNLTPSLFYNDAIVLKHIASNQIKLSSEKDEHSLTFSFRGFPYFGIWAAKDAPFVCLEPWCGIADNVHHDYQLENKEGINQLAAGEAWKRTWSVELF
ncbi:aldose 1-epimerase family protein [Ginsengibacter hankyongi]|uniref:Aldose 1-epimerase family protein n=1 Tax=Ginsengibacter hankyongi TaxID=2607284 RepID=A0A5J5IDB8_9BACT|nr:aldose 1-epimerase family protein [Ginsengibacter hankyongi]KAA9036510.1 aldose 1-epimerase family protein [Ginsengibacter hankyongi]